jgi:AcrR family transcriptional regulator
LECFVEAGYGSTGISDIQKRSGASIGSIYHFFGGKEGIAVALFADGLASWAKASLKLPSDAPAEDIVRASISNTIHWALANPKLYRFMEETRFLAPIMAAQDTTRAIVLEARSEGELFMEQLMRSGQVKALPWDLAHALILGPAYDWLRLHSHGFMTVDPETAIATLSHGAWMAIQVA